VVAVGGDEDDDFEIEMDDPLEEEHDDDDDDDDDDGEGGGDGNDGDGAGGDGKEEDAEGEPEEKTRDENAPQSHGHKWKEQLQFEQALSECLTISKSKIAIVTQLSCRFVHRYKDIVHLIEKFVRRGNTVNNTKLPQLYIIDSVCRAELREKNQRKFIKRFGRNIGKTFTALGRGPDSDKQTIRRVFTLWHKEKWFAADKQWKTIMGTMQKWKSTEGDSARKRKGGERAEDGDTPKKRKHHRKKRKESSSSKRRHKKNRDKHHRKSKSRDKAAAHSDSGPAAESPDRADCENNDAPNNSLLASLRSLTKQEDAGGIGGDGVSEREREGPPRLETEDEVDAKRKLDGADCDEPAAKKLKVDHAQPPNDGVVPLINGQQHHPPPPAAAPLPMAAAQPPPPAPAHPLQQHALTPYGGPPAQHPLSGGPLAPPHHHPMHGMVVAPAMRHRPHSAPFPVAQPPPQRPLPHHLQRPLHPHSRSNGHFQMGPHQGIGWELAPDQSNVMGDRYRVCSCTLYIGFWNDVHVDIEKLRAEGNVFGNVLNIMPHPTKPPHKHAFVQFATRSIAESAKLGLRKKFNELQFVQKVGWGRPPKLIKETFKFDAGMGEILKADAPHIIPMHHGPPHHPRQHPHPQPPQQQQPPPPPQQPQQHHGRQQQQQQQRAHPVQPPPNYGALNGPNPAMSAPTAPPPAAAANHNFMNMERARLISNGQQPPPQYPQYNPLRPPVPYLWPGQPAQSQYMHYR